MRRRPLLIYLPAVMLLMAAVVLPRMGRNVIGHMNAIELALALAFWWMVFAIGCRVVTKLVYLSRSEAAEGRGFEVVQQIGRTPHQNPGNAKVAEQPDSTQQ